MHGGLVSPISGGKSLPVRRFAQASPGRPETGMVSIHCMRGYPALAGQVERVRLRTRALGTYRDATDWRSQSSKCVAPMRGLSPGVRDRSFTAAPK